MNWVRAHGFAAAALGCAAALTAMSAGAGHELTYYPSFYPQEIRLELLDPEAAAEEFTNTTDPLHAYIGAAPRFAGETPGYVKSIGSFWSFIILDINLHSHAVQGRDARCRAVERVIAELREQAGVVVHPYPITPYHADYLNHADRTLDRKPAAFVSEGDDAPLTLRGGSPAMAALLPSQSSQSAESWDAILDEVAVSDLRVKAAAAGAGIWLAPPWAKDGWFQAYHLLRPAVSEPADQKRADAIYERLTRGEFRDDSQRIKLERDLVAALMHGCERAVVGYRLRREFYNDDFSDGIENIFFDSQSGFNSPMFPRVIKLKAFPWNGWLRVGIDSPPEAAWNPVAGFGDAPGRLVWGTVGDDAFLPIPHNSRWVANRVELRDEDNDVKPLQSLRVPADAMVPESGTGRLAPIGGEDFSWERLREAIAGRLAPIERTSATAKVTYRVASGSFQDGTRMETADLLYPYVLAFRWGERSSDGADFDPEIAAATQQLREQLRGVRSLGEEKETLLVSDLKVELIHETVEVYLENLSPDGQQRALVAPPWSSVPWHVLALMEAAVERGIAAFSKTEAERRGVPWLDLVRDPAQREKMAVLVKEFAESGWLPAALENLVTPETAKARWQALARFIEEHDHLLVTNGPYRLTSWSPEVTVFDVIRDFTYPIGIATFDSYSYPPRSMITAIERIGDRVEVTADVELAVREQRDRRMVRTPLTPDTLREKLPIHPQPRFLVIADDGKVALIGRSQREPDGRFVAVLPATLPPGVHTFYTAVFLDGNTVNPDIGRIELRGNE